jgi:transcriptional regulator with XRE-family HTH domain
MILGAQLRRLREACEISREAAGEAIRGSHSKISRLELGRHGFKARDVVDLLALYGVEDEAQRETLLALVEQANTPGWWQPFADLVPSWFEDCLGLEQAASVIRSYAPQTVHALLQTADYARAELARRYDEESQAQIDRRVELRMLRQEILFHPGGPRLWAVLDEAALCRLVGGTTVMRAQFDHLLEMVERQNVTVQILPFAVGPHAGLGGPLTILRLPETALPDVVYLEQHNSAHYPDRTVDVLFHRQVMDRISAEAARPEETPGHLHRISCQW